MGTIALLLLFLCVLVLIAMFKPLAPGGKSWLTQLNKPPAAPPESAIEVLELATEVLEKIDGRIDTLERLLREADKKIAGLRTINTAADERAAAKLKQKVDHTQPAELPRSDKRAMVLHLARRGMSSADIAQETGIGAGEVEFILNIAKNRKIDSSR